MKRPAFLLSLLLAGSALAGCAHAPRHTTIDDVTTTAGTILAVDDRPVERTPLGGRVTVIPAARVPGGAHELLVLRHDREPGVRAETVQVPARIDVHRRYRLDVVEGRLRVVPLPGDR